MTKYALAGSWGQATQHIDRNQGLWNAAYQRLLYPVLLILYAVF